MEAAATDIVKGLDSWGKTRMYVATEMIKIPQTWGQLL